jgi:hypothetical protein
LVVLAELELHSSQVELGLEPVALAGQPEIEAAPELAVKN